MKNSKTQKGITLIALIIIVVVLMILATVAISSIQNDGIIAHAQNAVDKFGNKQTEEQSFFDNSLLKLEEELARNKITWTDNGDGTFTSSNGVTVEIGDYVDYKEGSYTHTPDTAKGAGTSSTGGSNTTGYTLATTKLTTEDLSWRVLGVTEAGELELISADPTTQILYLANDEGYVYAEDNLNNFCYELYGRGFGAKEARSLNVNDINNLTKYNPSSNSNYDVEWTYRYPTQAEMDEYTETQNSTRYMQYSKDGGETWNNITSESYQTFRLPEETTAISSTNPGSKKVTHKNYSYTISTELTADDGYTSEKETEIANMITDGTASSNKNQWLASRSVGCLSKYADFTMRVVKDSKVNTTRQFGSYEYFLINNFYVRPVVTLKSSVSITTNEEDNSTTNMWTLSIANS